jgi:predicted DNA binding protein
VQYATMIDLLEKAERAGEQQTEFVNDKLAEAFESWLNRQDLREITEEEEHALRMAFEKGYGICFHPVQ